MVANSVIRKWMESLLFSSNCLYLISGSLSLAQPAIFRARMT